MWAAAESKASWLPLLFIPPPPPCSSLSVSFTHSLDEEQTKSSQSIYFPGKFRLAQRNAKKHTRPDSLSDVHIRSLITGPRSFMRVPLLVCWGRHTKMPYTGWLQTTEMYFLTDTGGSPRSRCWQGWFLLVSLEATTLLATQSAAFSVSSLRAPPCLRPHRLVEGTSAVGQGSHSRTPFTLDDFPKCPVAQCHHVNMRVGREHGSVYGDAACISVASP